MNAPYRKRAFPIHRLPGWVIALALCLWFSTQAATHLVQVLDSVFSPDQLLISMGDTVVWQQSDPLEHTVTSDDELFDSGTLFDGEEFSYTFETPGSYAYYCDFHGFRGGGGMAGIILVSKANENQPPNSPVNQSPTNGALNQPLAPQLTASAFSDPDALDFHAASQWLVHRFTGSQIVFDSGEDPANRTTLVVPAETLEPGTNYSWQVRYKDGRGAWSEFSAATVFTTLIPAVANGIGLRAMYFNLPDFATPLAVATNANVNFQWGKMRPHRRITADEFAARWEGRILPQFTERYEFQFQYQGRARVWVENQLLIDEWAGCSLSQTRRGAIALVGGQFASIRIEYAASTAGAQAVLRWESPSLPMEIIPSARLFPPSP